MYFPWSTVGGQPQVQPKIPVSVSVRVFLIEDSNSVVDPLRSRDGHDPDANHECNELVDADQLIVAELGCWDCHVRDDVGRRLPRIDR